MHNTIENVFNAIGHLELKGYNGEVLSDILTFIRNTVATVINYALDKVKSVVINGVEMAFGPVLSAIASVAGVVAVAGTILATVQPWFGKLTPDPRIFTRDTASHPGVLTLRVWTRGLQEWPKEVAGCARAVNVELPPLKPHGGKVTWTITGQRPGPMVKQISDTKTLAEDGTATLRFETLPESPEVAEGDTRYDGTVHVTALVHRTELDTLHERLTTYLLAQLPAVVAENFGPWIHAILDPRIKTLIEPLTKLRDTPVRSIVSVNYHTPDDEPKARPSSSPSSEPGKRAAIPLACPSAARIGHGFSSLGRISHLESEPGVVIACGYHASNRSLAIGVLDRPLKANGQTDPISIPGTDAAWISCDGPNSCLVHVAVGNRALTVTGGADRATAIEITKRSLGVR